MVHVDLQNMRKLDNFRGRQLSGDRIFCDTMSNAAVSHTYYTATVHTVAHSQQIIDLICSMEYHRIPITQGMFLCQNVHILPFCHSNLNLRDELFHTHMYVLANVISIKLELIFTARDVQRVSRLKIQIMLLKRV